MKSTRIRLLEYVGAHPAATASELSHALQVTVADVRHHLGILVEEGALAAVGTRPPRGRGRPAQRFSLAAQARKDSFDLLAGALLTEMPASGDEFLNRIAHRMAGAEGISRAASSSASLTRRLNQAMQRLNELNYQARWEAHAQAPHILLGRCPYAAILPEHPQLCRMDTFLLEALLGAPAAQKAKLARNALGGTYCLFLIERARGKEE